MDTNSIILVCYSLYWLAWLVWYQARTKKFTIGTLILGTYTLSSMASVYYYFQIPSFWSEHYSPWAFVYLGFCMSVCAYPFIRYATDLQECHFESRKNNFVLVFLIVSAPLILDVLLEVTRVALTTDVVNLADIYGETSKDVVGESMSSIGAKALAFVKMLSYIWPLLVFYCLTSDDKHFKWMALIPLAGVAAIWLAAYAAGRRVTIIRMMVYFLLIYFFAYKSINLELRKLMNRIFLIGGATLLVLLALITISRFNSYDFDFDVFTFVAWYAGEGEIRFAEHVWDLTRTSDGDTCFALVKEFMGLDTYTDLDVRRWVYNRKLNIPTHIFYTHIGDWYIDLGPYFTLLLSGVFSAASWILLRKSINKGKVKVLSAMIIAILANIVIFGITYFSFKAYGDQLTLLFGMIWIVVFLIFEYLENNNSQKSDEVIMEETSSPPDLLTDNSSNIEIKLVSK